MTGCKRGYFSSGIMVILLIGITLRTCGLSGNLLTGDEISSVLSAFNYLDGGSLGPTMWNHPNLRNLLLFGTISSGLPPLWAIKGVSLTLGSLTVLFVALVTKEISDSVLAALLAAFLLAVDSLHIDFSRQAVHEVYMACFSLAGVWLSLLYLRRRQWLSLVAAGICLGLGISSKWEPLFPLLVMFFFLMRDAFDKRHGEDRFAMALFVAASLIAIPLIIYFLTWVPWFIHGKDLTDWLLLHREMLRETTSHAGYNAYNYTIAHRAWEWFLKPVEFVDIVFGFREVRILVGITNPAVWCLVLPSVAFMSFQYFIKNRKDYLIIISLFLASYLPFLCTSRPIWAHSAFSVLAFGIIAIAVSVSTILPLPHARKAVLAYFLLVSLLSAPLFLLAIGEGERYSVLRPFVERYRPAHER